MAFTYKKLHVIQNTRYRLQETRYEVTVNHEYINNQILLRDVNIEKQIKKIVKELRNSYRNLSEYYINIELESGQIKKQYLKSGFYNLKNYLTAIYLLGSELDQVLHSSENLFFDNSFKITIFIFKTQQPGLYNSSQTHKRIARSNFTKSITRKVESLQITDFSIDFLSALSFGCIDLAAFYLQLDQCIDLTFLAIYLFTVLCNNDIMIFIHKLLCFKHLGQLEDMVLKNINKKYDSNDSLIIILKSWSLIFKRDILLFLQNGNFLRLTFQTENFRESISKPVMLLLKDNHLSLLYDNINLEKKNSKFCYYCRKTLLKQNFSYHICKRQICKVCFRFSDNCQNDIEYSGVCPNCNKCFKNLICKSIHEKLSLSICTKYLKCKNCKEIYFKRVESHQCNYIFCRKCLQYHDRSCNCVINIKPSQSSKRIFIVDIKLYNGGFLFSFSDLSSSSNNVKVYYNSKLLSYNFDESCNIYNNNITQLTHNYGKKPTIDIFLDLFPKDNTCLMFTENNLTYLIENTTLQNLEMT